MNFKDFDKKNNLPMELFEEIFYDADENKGYLFTGEPVLLFKNDVLTIEGLAINNKLAPRDEFMYLYGENMYYYAKFTYRNKCEYAFVTATGILLSSYSIFNDFFADKDNIGINDIHELIYVNEFGLEVSTLTFINEPTKKEIIKGLENIHSFDCIALMVNKLAEKFFDENKKVYDYAVNKSYEIMENSIVFEMFQQIIYSIANEYSENRNCSEYQLCCSANSVIKNIINADQNLVKDAFYSIMKIDKYINKNGYRSSIISDTKEISNGEIIKTYMNAPVIEEMFWDDNIEILSTIDSQLKILNTIKSFPDNIRKIDFENIKKHQKEFLQTNCIIDKCNIKAFVIKNIERFNRNFNKYYEDSLGIVNTEDRVDLHFSTAGHIYNDYGYDVSGEYSYDEDLDTQRRYALNECSRGIDDCIFGTNVTYCSKYGFDALKYNIDTNNRFLRSEGHKSILNRIDANFDIATKNGKISRFEF